MGARKMIDPQHELAAALGRCSVQDLVAMVEGFAGQRPGVYSALYEAEIARTGKGRPRSRLLDLLVRYTDTEPTLVDYVDALRAVQAMEASRP